MRWIRGGSWLERLLIIVRAPAIWRVGVVSLLLATACTNWRLPGSPPVVPEQPVDLNGEGPVGPTMVRVDNQNQLEMTIFAYLGSQRVRLGRAKPYETTDLVIPAAFVTSVSRMQFLAEPLGLRRSYSSELMQVAPGDQVDFFVPAR